VSGDGRAGDLSQLIAALGPEERRSLGVLAVVADPVTTEQTVTETQTETVTETETETATETVTVTAAEIP
jgi:hypothetical protein